MAKGIFKQVKHQELACTLEEMRKRLGEEPGVRACVQCLVSDIFF